MFLFSFPGVHPFFLHKEFKCLQINFDKYINRSDRVKNKFVSSCEISILGTSNGELNIDIASINLLLNIQQ